MLFMEAKDIRDVKGKVRFFANPCERDEGLTPPPGFVIGVFPLDGGGFEVYSAIRKGEERGNVIRLETSDFVSYSDPETVMTPDADRRAWVATMTHKPDGSEYLLNASGSWEKTFGLFFYRSVDGRRFERLTEGPAFTDHDAAYLFYDTQKERYGFAEATYMDVGWRRVPPDNHGDRPRRCITVRHSADGVTWTPGDNATKEHPLPPELVRAPDDDDSPDAELYWFLVFPYGDRYVGMVQTYASTPRGANPYYVDEGVNGFWEGRGPALHGPHLATEWWLTEDPTDIHAWRRPWREAEAGPLGFHVHHQPAVLDGRLVWFFGMKQSWFGEDSAPVHPVSIAAGRIAGVTATSNAAFSTPLFDASKTALSLDASCSFHGDKTLPAQRQAYIMVEVVDERGETIPGYEREDCLFRDVDDSRLPLRWGDKGTPSLAGRRVALRFHFRDSFVYGVG